MAMLDGSIRRSSDRLRVTVQLISTNDGAILWAEKFDEEFTNIFAVEDSISGQVAKALTLKLTGAERELLAKRHTDSTKAYQAYMRGQFFYNKKTPAGLKKAIKYFERAIKIDPNYALAYIELSKSYLYSFDLNLLSPDQSLLKAREYLQEASRVDDGLAEVHTTLALLKTYEWNWAEAENEYKLAIEINPNLSEIHYRYAALLRHLARFDEAMSQIRLAQELDPVSLSINTGIGTTLHFARRYDRAVKECQKALELDMDHPAIHYVMGLSYEQQGKYHKAMAEYQKANSFFNHDNPEVLASLGRVFALSGEISKARQILDRLVRQSKRKYVSPFYIASICICLGEKDQAFAWLEKAYKERDCELGLLKVDPRLDALRDDPRFLSLLQRVGLN
jgi:tetratricopeptide (TPR) repeat protein